MDVDFGAGLIMLLRWLGSVAVIVGGIAAVALLVDWLRGASRGRESRVRESRVRESGATGAEGRPASVSIVPDLDADRGRGGSGSGDSAQVSSLDAARAGRANGSTGARVA